MDKVSEILAFYDFQEREKERKRRQRQPAKNFKQILEEKKGEKNDKA